MVSKWWNYNFCYETWCTVIMNEPVTLHETYYNLIYFYIIFIQIYICMTKWTLCSWCIWDLKVIHSMIGLLIEPKVLSSYGGTFNIIWFWFWTCDNIWNYILSILNCFKITCCIDLEFNIAHCLWILSPS